MLQNVGSTLQVEQQVLESLVSELPGETQRQFKERVAAAQQQQLQQSGGSMLSLTGSRLDLFADGSDRSMLNRSTGNLANGSESSFTLTLGRKSCVPGNAKYVYLFERTLMGVCISSAAICDQNVLHVLDYEV